MAADGVVIWLEILLGFAVPMGWGLWQLIDLKREASRDAAKAADDGGGRI